MVASAMENARRMASSGATIAVKTLALSFFFFFSFAKRNPSYFRSPPSPFGGKCSLCAVHTGCGRGHQAGTTGLWSSTARIRGVPGRKSLSGTPGMPIRTETTAASFAVFSLLCPPLLVVTAPCGRSGIPHVSTKLSHKSQLISHNITKETPVLNGCFRNCTFFSYSDIAVILCRLHRTECSDERRLPPRRWSACRRIYGRSCGCCAGRSRGNSCLPWWSPAGRRGR